MHSRRCTRIHACGWMCVEHVCADVFLVHRCIGATDTKARHCVAYIELRHACSFTRVYMFVLCVYMTRVYIDAYVYMRACATEAFVLGGETHCGLARVNRRSRISLPG